MLLLGYGISMCITFKRLDTRAHNQDELGYIPAYEKHKRQHFNPLILLSGLHHDDERTDIDWPHTRPQRPPFSGSCVCTPWLAATHFAGPALWRHVLHRDVGAKDPIGAFVTPMSVVASAHHSITICRTFVPRFNRRRCLIHLECSYCNSCRRGCHVEVLVAIVGFMSRCCVDVVFEPLMIVGTNNDGGSSPAQGQGKKPTTS